MDSLAEQAGKHRDGPTYCEGFPGSSAGKKSACNVEDLSSIPGWGSSPGAEYGKRIQWVVTHSNILVAQMVKNPPATQEAWVRSRGGEDPLEKGMATRSNILA